MAKKRDKDLRYLKRRGKNGMFYFQGMLKSKRYNVALSTDEAEAIRLRDQYLYEINKFGDIQREEPKTAQPEDGMLFGEVAQQWVIIAQRKVKSSTLRDYRGAMNYYILPHFGNTPIRDISFLDVEKFTAKLTCSHKRINNILVPMRAVFTFALRAGYIEKNPMDLVENLKVSRPTINPLAMEEVNKFLECVHPYYKDFFVVAFFTGMRFGEMAVLKWKNVDFKLGVIKVLETRVRGEEGTPKTHGSVRDIKMLPPVISALKEQREKTLLKSPYVFLNKEGRPLRPNTLNFNIWKPALKQAGLKPRSLYQTRHTFATLMLDAGELPGWVASMMGHSSLKMILERYYSYIKNYERDDGSAFMEKVFAPSSHQKDEPVSPAV